MIIKRVLLILLLTLAFTGLQGCEEARIQPPMRKVTLRADGREVAFETLARTVQEALQERDVSLGERDLVEPSAWTELGRDTTITVIRVREIIQREAIPFARQVVKDEALSEGKTRLLQSGRVGALELTYRISSDGIQELSRQLVSRRVITEARSEIVAVGSGTESLAAVPISGTLAYIANGNAWIMRNNSAERRPVTFSGDLDGRVFDLSANGQYLLFSRSVDVTPITGTIAPFNDLWALDIRILQEGPKPLGVNNVLYAEWAADGRSIAYSTADSVALSPGWRAHNDLWVMSFTGITRTQILPPSSSGLYSWWGTRFAWNQDSKSFAYATADTVGVLDAQTGKSTPLVQFPVFHTQSEWVWTPYIAWSPEGRYLACVVHNLDRTSRAEDSALFDLWILDTQGKVSTRLVERVGMWANPTWSALWTDQQGQDHAEIAYGLAQIANYSQSSPYSLYLMDRDGSNKTRLLPPSGQTGLMNVDIAWSPHGRQLVCVWQGNLYLVSPNSGKYQQLTSGTSSENVRWKGQ